MPLKKDKFQEVVVKLDHLEDDQIQMIKDLKSSAIQDLNKRRSEEEHQREDLEKEIQIILDESSEGMDALDDEDVVSSNFKNHLNNIIIISIAKLTEFKALFKKKNI